MALSRSIFNTKSVRVLFPVSEGHTLVVPRRHVTSLWDLTPSEQHDIWDLMSQVRALLTSKHSPDAFNGSGTRTHCWCRWPPINHGIVQTKRLRVLRRVLG